MSLVDAVVAKEGKVECADIVWPPADKTAVWLGASAQILQEGLLSINFFTGGIVGNRLVRNRVVPMERGMLKVPAETIYNLLPDLLQDWVFQVICNPTANSIRDGVYGDLPKPHASLFKAKRRKLNRTHARALAQPPRCVKCALSQATPWKNRMRWMMAHTLVATASATGQPVSVLEAAAVAAMETRGDGPQRVREFQAAVRRASQGKIIRIPCKRRTKPSEGLWCPLGGNTQACASERGFEAPLSPTPADMWAPPSIPTP